MKFIRLKILLNPKGRNSIQKKKEKWNYLGNKIHKKTIKKAQNNINKINKIKYDNSFFIIKLKILQFLVC